MHAIRLARGFTGRDLIVKMDGCYHGAHDSVLVAAGSGGATFGNPDSAGVPAAVAANTLVVPFNDEAAIEQVFREHGDRIAAILVEPVPGNMGTIAPKERYLGALREISHKYGALLIFDEVMCGFRVSPGGAQELYRIKPDLTCLGKIVGGGFPLAAFGGRREVMEKLSPLGPVYQAGTLSGNPVAVAAGLATLKLLDEALYARLDGIGLRLEDGLREPLAYHGWSMARVGAMWTIYARSTVPSDFREGKECDTAAFGRFHRAALQGGVYLPPSQFEAAFHSAVFEDVQVDHAISAMAAAVVEAHS